MNTSEIKLLPGVLPQADLLIVHCADDETTQLVTVRYQSHVEPIQLSSEQHKHKDTRTFFILISISQHGYHPTSRFAHSLTQITAHKYPSVFNSAWSKHTICFCFIPIIFTTCILDKFQVQLHSWKSSAVPPGCCSGLRWNPGSFLMAMEEPLWQPSWDRKLHSAVKRSVGAGSDI